MDPKEFQNFGYLQEVNRKFFHPLGLALSVHTDETGTHFGGIWDMRADPEGLIFDTAIDVNKVMRVEEEYNRFKTVREKKFGYMVQPVTKVEDDKKES